MVLQIDEQAAIRFGFGLSPNQPNPQDLSSVLAQLNGVDTFAIKFPLYSTDQGLNALSDFAAARKVEKTGAADGAAMVKSQKKIVRQLSQQTYRNLFARAVDSTDGFRERLSWFWTDHFSVSARGRKLGVLMPTMIDSAIRPNLSGKFSDMLMAVNLHPAMLEYLDQSSSIGPNSDFAQKRKNKGLNENLAREMLELHTMGVGGGYSQTDVRELAELLTGLRVNAKGVRYNPVFAEPGTEYILGKSYGGEEEELRHIKQFLRDISVNPITAKHLARKLAVHFISDMPSEDLIEHMADKYLASDGNLHEIYSAMLSHTSAWETPRAKVKQPFDFVVSVHRALGGSGQGILALKRGRFNSQTHVPMRLMGQNFLQPDGPDGWPEDGEHWITPAGLAGRVQFAMQMAETMDGDVDPRAFVTQAVGRDASKDIHLAAARAESKIEGLALILASPDFNRR
ncbi:hypothetical protein GCM10008927_11790 [Amylibacter ulvae]|uniref:DUF1800 domain-containing protein n=2 Tax=Paramylibacter ulvae TaxID=1651968 RepID=A0ABQ3D1B0_9RHOB|nr:hypothetical protein GCM10008927_11790 [Amylibacter ulvae]